MNFKLSVYLDSDAVGCLTSQHFVTEWDNLLRATPSSTVCQSAKFALTWWSVYGSVCRIAIACCRDATGLLIGYYGMAKQGDRNWGPIGLHQCEYPAVLAYGDDPKIVCAILRALHRTLKFRRLQFIFLPPGSPVDGYAGAALAADVRECPLPYRAFADIDPPSKRTKQKIARLKKLGARTEVVDFAKSCDEFLPKFISIHEARQKAKGYTAPFEADPLKSRYLVALARDAHLLHVAAIWIDQRLVAATICLRDRSRIVVGMLAHDEEFESLSPAAVLVHELGALCANSEIRAIDLTPGGAYKERFATGTEMAFSAELTWSIGGAVRMLIRRLARYGLGQIRSFRAKISPASTAKSPM